MSLVIRERISLIHFMIYLGCRIYPLLNCYENSFVLPGFTMFWFINEDAWNLPANCWKGYFRNCHKKPKGVSGSWCNNYHKCSKEKEEEAWRSWTNCTGLFGNLGTIYGAWASASSQFLHVIRWKGSQVSYLWVLTGTVSKCTWKHLWKGTFITIIAWYYIEIIIWNWSQPSKRKFQRKDHRKIFVWYWCEAYCEVDASLFSNASPIKLANHAISLKIGLCPHLNFESWYKRTANLSYLCLKDLNAHLHTRSYSDPEFVDPSCWAT